MKQVKPNVFLIARAGPNHTEIRQWLDCIGATEFDVPTDVSPGTLLTTLAGKRCYMSYQPGLNPNVSKVRDDPTEFIDNILRVGHGSVIEHVSYTFAIENVSRIFTAEFNRHRCEFQNVVLSADKARPDKAGNTVLNRCQLDTESLSNLDIILATVVDCQNNFIKAGIVA